MELFFFIIGIVVLIVLIQTHNSKSQERTDKIIIMLNKIWEEQKRVSKELNELKQSAPKAGYSAYAKPEQAEETPTPEVKATPEPVKPVEDLERYQRPVNADLPVVPPAPTIPIPEIPKKEPIQEQRREKVLQTVKVQAAPKPPRPSFWERNPDLEKFIGENLINKIGIAILVIGIGFFVKFAIDQDWINEIGRVAIGIACGGILIGIAHKLREKFKAFSSVLIGGGLAILYITIAIAFHDYKIFDQSVAFAIMVLITCFAVFVSIAYNRQELAIIAFIGGLISPIMLSTGEGNYIVLFSYVILLNLGMLTLAYLRSWKILNSVAYGFTVLLFGGWLGKQVTDDKLPHLGALLFATAFYVIFFLMNIVNNIKEQRKFVMGEIMMLLSNTVLYYSAGMYILHNVENGLYKGLFTVLVALFNLVFAYSLFKSRKVDSNIIYLLIGLVLTFASLAAPIQLEGNYITLFWAIEAVLLLWLSQKSGIQLIKLAAFVVMILMWISLMMDWVHLYVFNNYEDTPHALLINKGLITSLVSAAAVGGFIFLLRKEGNKVFFVETKTIEIILQIFFIGILYLGILLEITYQLDSRIASYGAQRVYLGIYNLIFTSVLIFWLRRQKSQATEIISVILFGISCVSYIFYYNFRIEDVRDEYLMEHIFDLHYYLHYALAAIFVSIILQVRTLVFRERAFEAKAITLFNWVFCFLLIYLLSAEIEHLIVVASYTPPEYASIADAKAMTFKIIFPILWGLCSFGFMYFGMNRKVKTIRIISLVVFSITLLKLFIFDVSEMSYGGKIASFISLGVILLTVSFMYQKLKKIIADDEQKEKHEGSV